jgi:TFIIF-interacting CTD phosphatase-like protein
MMKKLLGGLIVGSGLYWYRLKTLPENEKFDIVFDLDHTLMKSKLKEDMDDLKLKRLPDFNILDGEYVVWTRPFYKILNLLNEICNLHIFTASTQDYADEILDNMYEPIFKNKLYRDACEDGKNLQLMCTDLNKAILIDDKLYNNIKPQKFYHIPQYQINNRYDYELVKVFVFIVGWYVKRDINKFKWKMMGVIV